jgi:HAD superfamily hydrolase (TIGR01509 family)
MDAGPPRGYTNQQYKRERESAMSWTLSERELNFTDPAVLSSLFAVGNGQCCTRGTLGEDRHESTRGLYVSGLFTRAPFGLTYLMAGPDWLRSYLLMGDREPTCTASERTLHMDQGTLSRCATFAEAGSRISLHEERFASLDLWNLMVQRVEVKVHQPHADTRFVLAVDSRARNQPAQYYHSGQMPNIDQTGVKLSDVTTLAAGEEVLVVSLLSKQTSAALETVALVRQIDGPDLEVEYDTHDGEARAVFRVPPDCPPDTTFAFLKLFLVFPSDDGLQLPVQEGTVLDELLDLADHADYPQLRENHVRRWERFWEDADVEIEGDPAAQLAVRFALWSTRIAAPDDEGESSIGSRNLTGDWYRGAVFWDVEMYQLPLLSAVEPQLARNHLLYRTGRLDPARSLAAQDGYDGARYPFQSFKSGLEEPFVADGPIYRQIHVNAAIAWGYANYVAMTGDDEILLDGGLEVLLELGKFWISRSTPGPDGKRHILDVCGPDTSHNHVDDNLYTNRLAAFVLDYTSRAVQRLSEDHPESVENILQQTGLTRDRLEQWPDVSASLALPTLPDGAPGVFAGFDELPEPDNRARRDKTATRADALLLFQALPEAFDTETLRRCYETYAPLCNQTSSLSLCTHAMLAIRLSLALDAQHYFETTIGIDLSDQAGNTRHGIHGAAEAGIWLAVVHGYGGLALDPAGGLDLHPRLPEGWKRLQYRFRYMGQPLRVSVTPEEVTVRNDGREAVRLDVYGNEIRVEPGHRQRCPAGGNWLRQNLQAVVLDLDELARHEDLTGLRKLLEALRQAGHRVGVVSAAKNAQALLKQLHLEEAVDAWVDADCLTEDKPDPQGFLLLSQRLRCLPWQCIGIESDDDGLEALRRAGMIAVGVGEVSAWADLKVQTLDRLSPDLLQKTFLAGDNPVNPYLEMNIAKTVAEESYGGPDATLGDEM